MTDYDVFISYSRKDSEIANQIYDALAAQGISCFIDREGISGGADFPLVLSEAIMNAKLLLLVASENSYASEFTLKEITFAVSNKGSRFIFPLIIDGSSLPKSLEFLLSNINWRTLSPRYRIEKEMVEEVKKKLANPHAGETLKQQEKNSAKLLLTVFFVLIGIGLLLAGAVLFKSRQASNKAEDDSELCLSYLTQSAALLQKADSIRTHRTFFRETFDQELECLSSAEELLQMVDSIRTPYLTDNNWFLTFSQFETAATGQTIRHQRDSMYREWRGYAQYNYQDYLEFPDEGNRILALEYVKNALRLNPSDHELQQMEAKLTP